MPSVNLRQLRETRRLKAWLRAGTTFELRGRDKVIARIVPETAEEKTGEMAGLRGPPAKKKIFGERVSNEDVNLLLPSLRPAPP
jgi:hypothetical protein